jgi:hypothetical protein
MAMIRTLAILAALLVPVAVPAAPAAEGTATLESGAPSREALVERLLAALRATDAEALHRLRVTRSEYTGLILPGTVPEGEAVRTWPENVTEYFWRVLDQKSLYYERHLLEQFGGRTLRVKSLDFDKGTRRFATYRAYRQVRLTLEDDTAREVELATGSIAEVAGTFKFISFIRD